MHEWAMAKEHQKIGTAGFDPCIAVVIMNDARGLAWVLHWPAMHHGAEELRKMLLDAKDESIPNDKLRIVLVGGCLDDGENKCVNDDIRKDREVTTDSVNAIILGAETSTHWGFT